MDDSALVFSLIAGAGLMAVVAAIVEKNARAILTALRSQR